MSALENFQQNVRAYMNEKGLTQTALADEIGVSDAWLSQVLSGARGLRIPTLEKVAAKMGGRSLSDLFKVPVQESTGRSRSVTPVPTESTSTQTPGDVDHVAQARLLEENTRLAKENVALRVALDELADQYKRLAAVVKTRPAQGGKSDLRRRR
jgi:transcriptional regulator with XRE-family HTH domain